MTRIERFKKLCEGFSIETDPEAGADNSADEDAQAYFLPEGDEDRKEVGRFAVVTASGEWVYVKADCQTLATAEATAVENVGDGIFAEGPLRIVDLDTGDEYRPDWSTLQWK